MSKVGLVNKVFKPEITSNQKSNVEGSGNIFILFIMNKINDFILLIYVLMIYFLCKYKY